MVDAPPDPDSDGDAGGEPDVGAPRWVKLLGVVALALILLFVVLHLTYGGPGGHAP